MATRENTTSTGVQLEHGDTYLLGTVLYGSACPECGTRLDFAFDADPDAPRYTAACRECETTVTATADRWRVEVAGGG